VEKNLALGLDTPLFSASLFPLFLKNEVEEFFVSIFVFFCFQCVYQSRGKRTGRTKKKEEENLPLSA